MRQIVFRAQLNFKTKFTNPYKNNTYEKSSKLLFKNPVLRILNISDLCPQIFLFSFVQHHLIALCKLSEGFLELFSQ